MVSALIRRFLPRFLAVGICMGVFMVTASTWHTLHFIHKAASVPGKVIRLQKVSPNSSDDTPTTTYKAVFQFKTADGNDYTVTSQLNAYPPTHKPGEAVTVLYAPAHPEAARIKSFWELWFFTTVATAITLVFLAFRIYVGRRKPHTPSTPA